MFKRPGKKIRIAFQKRLEFHCLRFLIRQHPQQKPREWHPSNSQRLTATGRQTLLRHKQREGCQGQRVDARVQWHQLGTGPVRLSGVNSQEPHATLQ